MFYRKTAYGISDRLVDFYVPLAILCAAAASIAIVVLTPEKWYAAFIVAPFAAWAGPIAITLPVYIVEILIFGILHPKKSYRNAVEFIAFFVFLIGSGVIALGIVRFCAAHFATPDSSTWEYAYVSESPNAHRYHYSEQCNALQRTTFDIEVMSVDEAEDYDYEPCSLCLKESVGEQWDDAAGFLFIPVSCFIYWIINKIDLFHKKYKFRSPIVRRKQANDA